MTRLFTWAVLSVVMVAFGAATLHVVGHVVCWAYWSWYGVFRGQERHYLELDSGEYLPHMLTGAIFIVAVAMVVGVLVTAWETCTGRLHRTH